MPDFKLVDHSDEVKEELQEAVLKALEEIGLRVERRAKKIRSGRYRPFKKQHFP